jgi:hypothetical protein
MLRHVIWYKVTVVSEVLAASITIDGGSFYQTTWRNIPEDSHLQTRRHENLKSRKFCTY